MRRGPWKMHEIPSLMRRKSVRRPAAVTTNANCTSALQQAHGLAGTAELYELLADPYERSDVISKHPQVACEMFGAAAEWLKGLPVYAR